MKSVEMFVGSRGNE